MKDDGGPAFPESGLSNLPNGEFIYGRSGMSLRDYFAIHASTDDVGLDTVSVSWCASNLGMTVEEYQKDPFTNYCRIIAQRRYTFADAMIAERSK